MAYEQKTKETDESVIAFIEDIDNARKKEDAYRLLALFEETTGYEPKMWGTSIIGFGSYHYRYASGHEGDAPLVGFRPGKPRSAFTLLPEIPDGTSCFGNWASIRRVRPAFMSARRRTSTWMC